MAHAARRAIAAHRTLLLLAACTRGALILLLPDRALAQDLAMEAHVKAPNAEAGDQFGWSVALSGDTLAVGANGEDSCSTSIATAAATDNTVRVASRAAANGSAAPPPLLPPPLVTPPLTPPPLTPPRRAELTSRATTAT